MDPYKNHKQYFWAAVSAGIGILGMFSANKKQKLEWIVALLVLTAIPCSIIVASIIIALKFSNPFKFLLT